MNKKTKEECYDEATLKSLGNNPNGTRMDVVYLAMDIYHSQFTSEISEEEISKMAEKEYPYDNELMEINKVLHTEVVGTQRRIYSAGIKRGLSLSQQKGNEISKEEISSKLTALSLEIASVRSSHPGLQKLTLKFKELEQYINGLSLSPQKTESSLEKELNEQRAIVIASAKTITELSFEMERLKQTYAEEKEKYALEVNADLIKSLAQKTESKEVTDDKIQKLAYDLYPIKASENMVDINEFARTHWVRGVLWGIELHSSPIEQKETPSTKKELSGWISVNDKLPSKEGTIFSSRVLTLDQHGDAEVCCYDYELKRWNTKYGGVTHWMPIPESPRKQEL